MEKKYLEAGEIVNTHGIKGEVKIVSWCDTPEFLCAFKVFSIDEKPVKVESARPHKNNVIAKLADIHDIDAAMALKNKIVYIDRSKVKLPEGRHFIADLIGLDILDTDSGNLLGKITDVLTLPSNEVYIVKGEGKEYMIPAVDEFIIETNVKDGFVRVRLIEGMEV